MKAERTDFGQFCIFIGPNASPLEVWPLSEPALKCLNFLESKGVATHKQCPGRTGGSLQVNQLEFEKEPVEVHQDFGKFCQ